MADGKGFFLVMHKKVFFLDQKRFFFSRNPAIAGFVLVSLRAHFHAKVQCLLGVGCDVLGFRLLVIKGSSDQLNLNELRALFTAAHLSNIGA